MVNRGDVYWMCPQGDAIEHLFIVTSDPAIDPVRVVLVPVTTREADSDESCVLFTMDHPCVKHDSCIDYRRANTVSAMQIDAAERAGRIRKSTPASPELMRKIIDGAKETRQLPQGCYRILHDQRLIG